MTFNYLSISEIEKYAYFRIPKKMFSDARFRRLSLEARITYGLLLDRASLSIQNGWIDPLGRVYIVFTTGELMEILQISKQKATNILHELDTGTGIGLIERRKTGRADRIYVMDFNTPQADDEIVRYLPSKEASCFEPENNSLPNTNLSDNSASILVRSKNLTSEVSKLDPNNTDNNKTKINLVSFGRTDESENGVLGRTEAEKLVSEQVAFIPNPSSTDSIFLAIKEILLEVYTSKRDMLTLGRVQTPTATAKNRLMSLTPDEVHGVYERVTAIGQIKSPRAYCFKALMSPAFTAPAPKKDLRSWERQYTHEEISALEERLLSAQHRKEAE